MKKLVKTLIIAGAVSMASMTAFAAPSGQTSGSSSSHHSSSSSSSSSNSSTTSTTVSKTLSNGQSVTVVGATTDASGNVTSGLVANSSSGVSAAVGVAKRAGLPAAVTTTLNDLDAGKLTSVPAEAAAVANKQVLAQSVALVHITAPTEQKLIMAKSKIPASGVVQVLYYDNTTGRFTVLTATVDAATGVVTFTAPADGTAVIIG